MQRMLDDGVATRRGVMNAHIARRPIRAGPGERAGIARATASRRSDDTLVLPLFHQMTADEQDRVIASLTRAVRA